MTNDLTQGSVARTLFGFSVPYLIASFLQTFYGMADLFITGRYNGAEVIGAVAIGSQIMHMLTVMIVGLSVGVTVRLGNAAGKGDRKSVSRIIGTTACVFLASSFALALVLLGCTDPILSLLATPQEAFPSAHAYVRICFAGIPCIVAYNVLASLYRGLGDAKTPMVFVAIAGVVNVFLDWLCIGPLGMGAAGAALATVISQACSVVLALLHLHRHPLAPLSPGSLRPDPGTARDILAIGLPVCLQEGFIQTSFLLITMIVNRRGVVDAAAVGIVEKIISFLFLMPSSMMSSVSAIASQDLGAGKRERAIGTLRLAMRTSFCFGLAIALLVQAAASPVLSLFTHDGAVVASGTAYFRSYVWDCCFASIQFCFSGYFNACGKSAYSFLQNMLSVLLVRIPGSWWASAAFPGTLYPMGWAPPLGSLFSSCVCLLLFRHLERR